MVLADVAVSGIPPSHLAVSFTLPPEMTDDQLARCGGRHDEADDLGVSIVTGHTARYAGCSYPWVGGATALAVGDHDDVVRPDGATPATTCSSRRGPGGSHRPVATLFPTPIGLSPDRTATAQERRPTPHSSRTPWLRRTRT